MKLPYKCLLSIYLIYKLIFIYYKLILIWREDSPWANPKIVKPSAKGLMLTTNQRPESKGAFVGYVIPQTKNSIVKFYFETTLINLIDRITVYCVTFGIEVSDISEEKLSFEWCSRAKGSFLLQACYHRIYAFFYAVIAKKVTFLRMSIRRAVLPALSNSVRRSLVGRNWVRQWQDRYKWRANEWSNEIFPYQGGKRPTCRSPVPYFL